MWLSLLSWPTKNSIKLLQCITIFRSITMFRGTDNIPLNILEYYLCFIDVFPLFTNNDQFLKFCPMRVLNCFRSTPIPCESFCSGNRQEASRAWISTTVEAVWRRVGKPGEPNSYLSPLCKSLFSSNIYLLWFLNTQHNIIQIHKSVQWV